MAFKLRWSTSSRGSTRVAKKRQGLNIFLGIALALVLFGLFNLGVNTFYPQPDFSKYCTQTIQTYTDSASCTANGGLWYASPAPGYCDATFTCSKAYNLAQSGYINNIFYILLVSGIILSIFGFYNKRLIYQITTIGAGFALIIEAIVRNYQNKVPVFVAGLIAFAILVYFINRRFIR